MAGTFHSFTIPSRLPDARDWPSALNASSTWERAVKWTKRRPAVAALVIVSGVALVGLLTGTLWFNSRLRQEQATTREKRDRAQERLCRALPEQARAERLSDDHGVEVLGNEFIRPLFPASRFVVTARHGSLSAFRCSRRCWTCFFAARLRFQTKIVIAPAMRSDE
jgi:hypothetical protein